MASPTKGTEKLAKSKIMSQVDESKKPVAAAVAEEVASYRVEPDSVKETIVKTKSKNEGKGVEKKVATVLVGPKAPRVVESPKSVPIEKPCARDWSQAKSESGKERRESIEELKKEEDAKEEAQAGGGRGTSEPVLFDVTARPMDPAKTSKTVGQQQSEYGPVNVAVPRQRTPLPIPVLKGRPLILATHLVPSLPVGLFEVLAEAIEVATGRPVVLIYESRANRPVAENIADIAVLPSSGTWGDGELLPATFVFSHRLNKEHSAGVYADIIVSADSAPYVQEILDLRGLRCALPDRREPRGTAALLLSELRERGEGPAFFGNTLDSGSQLAALQMVVGNQAQVGILESPVVQSHKNSLPGVRHLQILASLGPLPPYPIFTSKSLPADLKDKITSFLLEIVNNEDWLERLLPYGVIGFTENSPDFYIVDESKPVVTSAPYY